MERKRDPHSVQCPHCYSENYRLAGRRKVEKKGQVSVLIDHFTCSRCEHLFVATRMALTRIERVAG